MRDHLQRAVYNLVFLDDGGQITAPNPILSYTDAKRARNEAYVLSVKVVERVLKTLRDPSAGVIEAMAQAVESDGDIRAEWQAGVEAAGQR